MSVRREHVSTHHIESPGKLSPKTKCQGFPSSSTSREHSSRGYRLCFRELISASRFERCCGERKSTADQSKAKANVNLRISPIETCRHFDAKIMCTAKTDIERRTCLSARPQIKSRLVPRRPRRSLLQQTPYPRKFAPSFLDDRQTSWLKRGYVLEDWLGVTPIAQNVFSCEWVKRNTEPQVEVRSMFHAIFYEYRVT